MRSAQPWIRVSLYTWEIRREDFVLMSKMKIERFKNRNRLADRGLTAPDVQAVPDFMDYDIKRQFLCLFSPADNRPQGTQMYSVGWIYIQSNEQ